MSRGALPRRCGHLSQTGHLAAWPAAHPLRATPATGVAENGRSRLLACLGKRFFVVWRVRRRDHRLPLGLTQPLGRHPTATVATISSPKPPHDPQGHNVPEPAAAGPATRLEGVARGSPRCSWRRPPSPPGSGRPGATHTLHATPCYGSLPGAPSAVTSPFPHSPARLRTLSVLVMTHRGGRILPVAHRSAHSGNSRRGVEQVVKYNRNLPESTERARATARRDG